MPEDETHSSPRHTPASDEPTQPAGDSMLTADAALAGPAGGTAAPDSFTGYTILREIHRGGQGVVYQAVQKSTKRKVAIKVMREGPFAGSADKARFDREIQVLGQLNHPNIVAIHETGIAAGCHYFVMDYISGQPLDVYMQSPGAPGRSIDETLRLFAMICDAVNAAHLRGVIHRDLKPGNIRIDVDDKPHVLDFGLAKVATTDAEASAMTMTGQFMGSLPWASPEQAEALPSKIDVRTDVYSLGVILYQMLTGKFPYGVVGNMRDVLDNILKSEPTRPSTIRKQINDEVETIVLKCLAKERERRYQTAGELARDIRHYLAGEPIEAKRDSTLYVLRKQLRRYRAPVALAALFVAVVTAGLVTSLTLWRRAAYQAQRAEAAWAAETQQRRLAEQREEEAIAARNAEAEQRDRAERERERTEAVLGFLTGDLLAAVSPEQQGKDVLMRDVLDAAAERIEEASRADGRFADRPLIEASIRQTLGDTYESLGLYDPAEFHTRRALALRRERLGEEHPDTLGSRHSLAGVYYRQGRYDEAETLYAKTLEISRRVLGDEHPDTLHTMNNLAVLLHDRNKLSEAEALCRETLDGQRRLVGNDHPDTLTSLNNLARLVEAQGRYDEAAPLYRQTLEVQRRVLGDDHPDTLTSMNNLGALLKTQGKLSEAAVLYQQALETRRRVLGEQHPETLNTMNNLAILLQQQGRLPEAERLLRQTLEGRRHVLGDDHPHTLASMNNLAVLLKVQGKLSEAEALYQHALGVQRRVLGDEHPDTLASMNNLGRLLQQQGRLAEAEPLCRHALDTRRRTLGDNHVHTLTSMNNLALLLQKQGKLSEAEPLFRQTLAGIRQLLGDDHPYAFASLNNLAALLEDQGQLSEAEPLYRQALEGRRRVLGAEHPNTLVSMNNLAALLQVQGRLSEAERLLREALSIGRDAVPTGHPEVARSLVLLGGVLTDKGEPGTAEPLLREGLHIQRTASPESHRVIAQAESLLGGCLTKLGRFDEAEPLLLKSYRNLTADDRAGDRQTLSTLQRLIDLYDAWGNLQQAAEWRTKLQALRSPGSQPRDDGP